MPLVDQDARRQFAREWTAARKREWLAAHPCGDCGNPAVTIRSTVPGGIHKGAWSATPERRERLLRDTVTLCESCVRERRRAADEVRTERQREGNREHMRRARAAAPPREPKRRGRPPRQPAPEPETTAERPLPAVEPDRPEPKRRGRPPGKRTPPAPVELSSDLSRRMERRRWREERRERLGYGPEPSPPGCRVCGSAHWPDEDCPDEPWVPSIHAG